MFKKSYQFLAIFAGLLLLVGCKKGSSDESQEGILGRWVPVYACGRELGPPHDKYYDGKVDKNGEISVLYVDTSNPDSRHIHQIGVNFSSKTGTIEEWMEK